MVGSMQLFHDRNMHIPKSPSLLSRAHGPLYTSKSVQTQTYYCTAGTHIPPSIPIPWPSENLALALFRFFRSPISISAILDQAPSFSPSFTFRPTQNGDVVTNSRTRFSQIV